MIKELLKVKRPGLLTTIQDLGRFGYQQYGIVASGVMDTFSMQIANLLVGNNRADAVIEVSLSGPTFEALDDMIIAICGGNLSPMIDGEKIEMWRSFLLKRGQTLSFGEPISGARAYLSIAGGIDTPTIMGSKSTYLKASIGGFHGRALQKGDIIEGLGLFEKRRVGRKINHEDIPKYQDTVQVHVVIGPHEDSFTDDALTRFFSSEYKITPQSDRMGYRLSGTSIEHKQESEIISDAIPFGGIQVPANGQPIILMSDRQTTGGYPRIGTVISVDLPYLAQAKPGQTVQFIDISVEEAQKLYRQREDFFRYVTCGERMKR